jgi:hypothetical protein
MQVHAGSTISISKQLASLAPRHLSFDSNKNDIWTKRTNTLNKFVCLVSKWIIRNRADKNKKKLVSFLLANGLTSKNAVAAYVEADNSMKTVNGAPPPSIENSVIKSKKSTRAGGSDVNDVIISPKSLAELLTVAFPRGYPVSSTTQSESAPSSSQSGPSERVIGETNIEEFIDELVRVHMQDEVTFNQLISSSSSQIKQSNDVNIPSNNNNSGNKVFKRAKIANDTPDRRRQSLFGMTNTEISHMNGGDNNMTFTLPPLGLFQPLHDDINNNMRQAADSDMMMTEILLEDYNHKIEGHSDKISGATDCSFEPPAWMTSNSDIGAFIYKYGGDNELDYLAPRPDFRVYTAEPRRCGLDSDWTLRPRLDELPLNKIETLRSK